MAAPGVVGGAAREFALEPGAAVEDDVFDARVVLHLAVGRVDHAQVLRVGVQRRQQLVARSSQRKAAQRELDLLFVRVFGPGMHQAVGPPVVEQPLHERRRFAAQRRADALAEHHQRAADAPLQHAVDLQLHGAAGAEQFAVGRLLLPAEHVDRRAARLGPGLQRIGQFNGSRREILGR
ncbi:MAG: hypothetical protein JSR59_02200 [Proteobacteria bacterium]|nr:hypothetical protein [Pseudomonadota bacterium]